MPSRRDLLAAALALWTDARLRAQHHAGSPAPAGAYRLQFFTAKEKDTVAALAAKMIPATERSGGAAAARVWEYMDFILAGAAPGLKSTWRQGLAGIADPRAWLETNSRHEFTPQTPAERFFVLFKSALVDAFYTSEEGITRELGYLGNGALTEFPGCTHTTHETPAGYRPRLRR